MKFDVVTIGSAFLDILVKSKSFKLVKSQEFLGGVAICEAYGGKVEADQIEISSGGGGTNNAVSFARKGLNTAIVAEMGKDIASKMIIQELIREGVDTQFAVVEEGEQTAVSVILVSGDAGRSVVSYRGASKMLTNKDIPWEELKTDWLHITSLGGKIYLIEELFKWARKNKVKIAFNPGKGELAQPKRISKILEDVEVLILNQEEATLLTGKKYIDWKIFKEEGGIDGPSISVVTAGTMGGKVCADGKCVYYEGKKLEPVSTLGAGDAFGSGLVAALIKGKELKTAIEWGIKNAESVLKYLSAKEGLLRLSQL